MSSPSIGYDLVESQAGVLGELYDPGTGPEGIPAKTPLALIPGTINRYRVAPAGARIDGFAVNGAAAIGEQITVLRRGRMRVPAVNGTPATNSTAEYAASGGPAIKLAAAGDWVGGITRTNTTGAPGGGFVVVDFGYFTYLKV